MNKQLAQLSLGREHHPMVCVIGVSKHTINL
jgi:hypothetical protein